MKFQLTHTKHPDYQTNYVGRTAEVVGEQDGLVLYHVIQNGKVTVPNYVLPRSDFRKRYG